MEKHRGFPGRYPSSDHQFVIRRANPRGATPLVRRERYADRSAADRRVDAAFLGALIDHFGDQPFARGNLDAGRLSWLLGREVVAVGRFDPTDYDQRLCVDMARARASFPDLFADTADTHPHDDAGGDDTGRDDDTGDGDPDGDDDGAAPPARRRSARQRRSA